MLFKDLAVDDRFKDKESDKIYTKIVFSRGLCANAWYRRDGVVYRMLALFDDDDEVEKYDGQTAE